uniref:Glutamate decarboxylase n=1 Tax=Meloidogyne javanica TaxID=6303 RepID=A0A915N6B2_MELJA
MEDSKNQQKETTKIEQKLQNGPFFTEKMENKNLFATDLFPHNPRGWEETSKFLKSIVELLLGYIKEENDRSTKVLEFHQPEEMAKLIDLNIPEDPMSLNELIKSCSEVLRLGVRTGHPHFFNQLSQGLDLIAMAGEWLTATCNTNMFTYEICIARFHFNGERGGAIANLYAVNAARHAVFPRAKHLGMVSIPPLCCFTSEESHYSIKSAAAVLGIGADNCFNIPTDASGRMLPRALEEQIIKSKEEGLYPFFVCATAGTTVYGAWDPIEEISEICERHNLWLHVDAAWGGGILLSPEYRHKLAGIERAKSVTWNPHKLMGSLLQCSACFGLLFQVNQMSADYLFQQDKPYDVSYDTGDKAIQCGRHNDIFKLWLMWRSKGMEGYRRQINRLMDMAKYFTERIKATEGFEMVVDEVGYQPDEHKKRPNFFRMVISNSNVQKVDLDFIIDEIVNLGYDL